jgi:hypothetical protein
MAGAMAVSEQVALGSDGSKTVRGNGTVLETLNMGLVFLNGRLLRRVDLYRSIEPTLRNGMRLSNDRPVHDAVVCCCVLHDAL